MKSVKIVVCALVVLGVLFGICACAWADVYPCSFLVEELDYDVDAVTFSDMLGEQWLWQGCEDWQVNDLAAAIMDDNGTPQTVYDDVIVKVYYQTNVDNWFEPDEVWDE